MTYKRPEVTEKMNKQGRQLALDVLENGVKAGKKTDTKKALHHAEKFYKTVLKAAAPKRILIVESPEAAVQAAMEATGNDRKSVIRQLIFLNLWVWWPTRAWAALNIRGIDPEKEGIRAEAVTFTNEKFEMSKDLHAILCCSDTCFVVEFPTVFAAEYDLKKFRLHRDGGLAIEYADGTGFGYLNHVEVPNWVCCTPAEELDTAKVMAIQSADVRREGLNRIPNEKKIKDLGAIILHHEKLGDEPWLEVEILNVDFKDGKTRHVFKALDPASGRHIFERVDEKDPQCSTARGCAGWRDKERNFIKPSVRT